MKKEHAIMWAGIILVIGLLWYYLRTSMQPMNIIAPNAGAGGLPPLQIPAVTSSFGVPQAAPSPALIYGPPPALPSTPDYQRYNYSPLNIFMLTPEAAATAPGPSGKSNGASISPGSASCCDCGSSCPDTGCAKFQDGNSGVCVAANKTEQIQGAMSQIFPNVQFNLATSVQNPGAFTPDISTVVPLNAGF